MFYSLIPFLKIIVYLLEEEFILAILSINVAAVYEMCLHISSQMFANRMALK